MRLLLDTHAFIWFADRQQSSNLPQATSAILQDPGNTLFLSSASIWEMVIKVAIGKLKLSEPVTQLVKFHLANNSISLLPTRMSHYQELESLPMHHRDPFDRLLICQAIVENLMIISVDQAFAPYQVNRIWLT